MDQSVDWLIDWLIDWLVARSLDWLIGWVCWCVVFLCRRICVDRDVRPESCPQVYPESSAVRCHHISHFCHDWREDLPRPLAGEPSGGDSAGLNADTLPTARSRVWLAPRNWHFSADAGLSAGPSTDHRRIPTHLQTRQDRHFRRNLESQAQIQRHGHATQCALLSLSGILQGHFRKSQLIYPYGIYSSFFSLFFHSCRHFHLP